MGWVARSIFRGAWVQLAVLSCDGMRRRWFLRCFRTCWRAMFHLFGLYTAKAAFAILSINSLFSALTCIPLYFSARYAAGREGGGDGRVGLGDLPVLRSISQADAVWDYALTGPAVHDVLLLRATSCTGRTTACWSWLGFGVVYGATATLANPSVLTMFPVFLLLAVLEMRRSDVAVGCCDVLWPRLGLIAMLTPWTIHNYRAMHFVGPVRDNFWLECWAGNNGDTFESNAVWAHPASNPDGDAAV